ASSSRRARATGSWASGSPGSSTRIATRPSSRSSRTRAEEPSSALVERDAEGVQRHRQHLVMTDEQTELDDLGLARLGGELAPGVLTDLAVLVELAARVQERVLARRPARGGDVFPPDPLDGLVREPGLLAESGVMIPLVLAPHQPRDVEDHELGLHPL